MTVGMIRRIEGDKKLAQQSILSRAYSREEILQNMLERKSSEGGDGQDN